MLKKQVKNSWTEKNFPSNGYAAEIFYLLLNRFGPQHWWPGESPFEVLVGAILTQNTAWSNVARAIKNLKDAGYLNPKSLYTLPITELSQIIRTSGYYNIKAQRLKEFMEHLFRHHQGCIERMFSQDLSPLRQELLGIKGIGPETADSILLYAAQKPIFVVDAYTKRIFSRHGLFPENLPYADMQAFFIERLPQDVYVYNEYHALIVKLAKVHCKKKAVCYQCPLEKEQFPFNGGSA